MNTLKLFEPQSGILSVPYEPNDQSKLLENPPRFTWMPALAEGDCYALQYSSSPDFKTGDTVTVRNIPYNLYTPSEALEPGSYYWRYALEGGRPASSRSGSQACSVSKTVGGDLDGSIGSSWSVVRSFQVPEGLPETPLPDRDGRYSSTIATHPRLWLNQDGLQSLRERIAADPAYAGWDVFMERSVQPWLERELIAEPAPYPDNKRVAALWRRMYMDCQETLYAIRHLSVAGVVLKDETILEAAKKWLLHTASWNAEGTTSRDYNDESSFRIAGALAWGYDWLHDVLNEEERKAVREALLERARQVAFHVIDRSRIHQVPFDSHAVRSLSSVLVPAAIALLHEEPEAQEWLDYTLEYYACLYSPWGGEDGGWAEGPMYWTTGMAYLIDALNLVRNYCGIDMYKRPFFSKTGDFPLYCYSPDTTRASFGDQSSLGERPILKTGYNIRQFAGITGNGLYQWYYEQTLDNDPDPDSKFYNYGWWDFRFDSVMFRHDYPEVAPVIPDESVIEPVKWFRDIGWVAMHHRMHEPSEHVMLLAKSSPYGSISHSHGDQNGFLIHAFGEPLAIESGYYVAFGSTMHRNWRRQTSSTNALLIDGQGQYAGTNKVLAMEAAGVVQEAWHKDGISYCRSDATAAYNETVPYVKRCMREIYFIDQSYFVIVDYVDLEQKGKVEWLLHTMNQMTLSSNAFLVNGTKADMDVRFVYSSSGSLSLRQHDEFTDVEPSEYEGLPKQWHLHAETKEARSHRLVSLLVPMKKGDSKFVSHFMDDQDHGVHLYFTNEAGKTRKIEVAKAY
ncbi:DUF4962 domain-containing protein [Paenibacillus sp. PL2-23]|uniref:DUF4962 domain-containing protein n=1 Tax=Paenibacillus sp. PL2-23 TaxID=2100729 RepID=UPI0030FB6399